MLTGWPARVLTLSDHVPQLSGQPLPLAQGRVSLEAHYRGEAAVTALNTGHVEVIGVMGPC